VPETLSEVSLLAYLLIEGVETPRSVQPKPAMVTARMPRKPRY
jgi:hypothetical protein